MRSRLQAIVAVLILVVAACGDDDSAVDTTSTTAPGVTTATTAATTTTAEEEGCTEARKGGTLTMVASSVTNALDPIVALGSSRGHLENIAFYDTLLYFNAETGEYEPQLAQSLTPNADASVWTMKLRPGVKFGNGDPLTADAVRFNVERMAGSKRVAAGMAARIASMKVIDDLTIEFTLVAPWDGLPYYFAHGGALVANPALVEERGEGLATNPLGAGAGPYEFVSYAPDEAVVLKAKDDYWGGLVCIDELHFVPNAVAQSVYDSFKTGEIDAFFITDQKVIAQAKAGGVDGQGWVYGGSGFHLNSGRGEAPLLADLRLRQAIAHALDLDTINERVWEGEGLPNSGLTHPTQLIYSGVDGPDYDPDLSRKLVAEVKAETGWDGSVRLTCPNAPDQVELTITVEAMLEAVGFVVAAENLPTAEASTKVLTEGNYDIGCGTAVVFDEAPERGLGQFTTGSPQNRVGFGDPRLDAAIAKLDTATGPAEVRVVMAEIQTIWNELIPDVWTNAGEWFIGWNEKVHGLKPHIASVVLFDDAWIES